MSGMWVGRVVLDEGRELRSIVDAYAPHDGASDVPILKPLLITAASVLSAVTIAYAVAILPTYQADSTASPEREVAVAAADSSMRTRRGDLCENQTWPYYSRECLAHGAARPASGAR